MWPYLIVPLHELLNGAKFAAQQLQRAPEPLNLPVRLRVLVTPPPQLNLGGGTNYGITQLIWGFSIDMALGGATPASIYFNK